MGPPGPFIYYQKTLRIKTNPHLLWFNYHVYKTGNPHILLFFRKLAYQHFGLFEFGNHRKSKVSFFRFYVSYIFVCFVASTVGILCHVLRKARLRRVKAVYSTTDQYRERGSRVRHGVRKWGGEASCPLETGNLAQTLHPLHPRSAKSLAGGAVRQECC